MGFFLEKILLSIKKCIISYNLLYLRFMNSKSLKVFIELLLTPNLIIFFISLINNGTTGYDFINRKIVSKFHIPIQFLAHAYYLLLADNKPNNILSKYALMKIYIDNYKEICLFYITILITKDLIIFNLP